MKKGTGSAFPSEFTRDNDGGISRTFSTGMSTRLYLASLKMDAIISNADTMRELTKSYEAIKGVKKDFAESVADVALWYADALIKQEEESR